MDKISIKEIDFSKLQKARIQGTQSIVYFDRDNCIKVFNDCSKEQLDILYRKFIEMDGIKIDGVIFPKTLIMDGDTVKAYVMERFKDSINLYDYFTRNKFVSVNKILEAVNKASLVLREIHQNDIICQDLSFENILINSDGDIRYVDLDSCCYDHYCSPYVSMLLNRYMIKYRKENFIPPTRKMDKLSFMLSFFLLMYLNEIQDVSKKQYKSLSSNISTLENLYAYRNILLDKKKRIPLIPYLDELINLEDDYIIDRDTQLTPKQKVIRMIDKRLFLE